MRPRHTISARRPAKPSEPCIASDEAVVFFPTAASFERREGWQAPIHGWVHRPAELSRLRRHTLRLVKRFTHLRFPRADLSTPLFQQRVGAFLSDNDRGCRVRIQFDGAGDPSFTLKKSRANGHFEEILQLPAISKSSSSIPSSGRWLTFRAVMPPNDARIFEGRVLRLPPEGLSIVSDIDDTIKVSQVLDRRLMLRNTFLKDFTSVAGMANCYQLWATKQNAAFHYVSASPWHLYPFLAEFLTAQEFPAGTFHLRDFRLMPRNMAQTLTPSRRVKSGHIRALLTRFPRRRFWLIGDSGESDARLYARFAREFPQQINKIFIRNVTEEPLASPRWRRDFAGLAPESWQVFTDPAEICD